MKAGASWRAVSAALESGAGGPGGGWQWGPSVGLGVVGEPCSAAAPHAGTTVGNDFKATTMEIKGMRM